MKRRLLIILCILIGITCGCTEKAGTDAVSEVTVTLGVQTIEQLQIKETAEQDVKSDYDPLNYENPKAIWFTMMDYKNILEGKSEKEFTDNAVSILKKIKDAGFNTIYVHVRPYNDAYYKSEIFPRADYYSDEMNYDPLEIIISEGHKAKLSVHSWINPLRCQTDAQLKELDNKYIIKQWYDDNSKNGTYIIKINDRWYLNPAYEEVRNYVADGVREIAENYNIDGIHIDDYFYPTQEESFDTAAFKESGNSDLKQWRTENIDNLVKGVYNTIKNVNPNIIFGISPQGNIDSDCNVLYADVKKWCSEEGYCDYIVPQIYYGFENESLPFENTVNEWLKLNTCDNVKLIIGICTYKIGKEDKWAGSGKNEWKETKGIPAKQAEFVFKNKTDGIAVYSYESLFADSIKEEQNKLTEVLIKNNQGE